MQGNTNPLQKLQLGVMGAVAEFERCLILERQREGIELAKKKVDTSSIKAKVKNVIDFCNLLLESIGDDKLSAEECDRIVDSAEKLIQ